MSGTALPQLGKYAINAVLGKGAMGTVYDGMDPVIGRRVAIKTVRLPQAHDEEAMEGLARFKREAQAAGRLNHPNIVGVFDYGETADLAYIVMEFVDGHSLLDMLEKEQRLPLSETLRLMDDILAGLTYSHERGVVHRDIKPANIMITREGRAKIADFGIARIESSSMTQAGTVLGTPSYMSPEQFVGDIVDKRTDIYAAGVTLYHLLAGTKPFDGALTAIMHKVLNTMPPSPSEQSVTAPPELDWIVIRAMARKPEDRFPDAAAFASALRTWNAPTPDEQDATIVAVRSRPAPLQPASVAPQPIAKPPNRVPVIAVGAIAALAAAGVVGWLVLSPGADVKPPGPAAPAAESVGTGGSQPQLATQQPTAPVPTVAVQPAQLPSQPSAPLQQSGGQVPPSAEVPVPARSPPPPAPPLAESRPSVQAPVFPSPSQTPPPRAPTPPPVPPASVTASNVPVPAATPPSAVPEISRPLPSSVPVTQAAPVASPAAPVDVVPTQPARVPDQAIAGIQRPAGLSRAAIAASLPNLGCSLSYVSLADTGTVGVTGFAGTGEPAAAFRQFAPGADIRLDTFNGPFCRALDTVRPFAHRNGAARLPLSLPSGGMLHDNEVLALGVTMPDFAGHLLVEYLQHDSTVWHHLPSAPYPDRTYAADEYTEFGRKRGTFKGWTVEPPFGTDMVLVIASTAPLFARPRADGEPLDAYVRDLLAAIADLRRRGGNLAANAVLVRIEP